MKQRVFLLFGFLVFVMVIYEEYIILKDIWINEEFLYKDPPVKADFQITGLFIN